MCLRLNYHSPFIAGQYRLLKEENERLKIAFFSATPEATRSPINWQMLDMEKLNLS